jgi:exopolysaccharide production protein ExoQ
LPPPLALALCTIFVVFLLRLERKQAPDVTRGLWIPTIWMLYIASKPIGIWFQAGSTNPEMGSPMDRVFLTVLMLMALLVLFRRGFDWAGAVKGNAWLVALFAFMLISVVWSDIPGTSLKRWIREFQAILMAFVVLSEPSPRKALESILRRTTYILIPISLVLIKYFPIYGVDYGRWSGVQAWIGVAQQKNGLAGVCIISGAFLIWSLIRGRRRDGPSIWKYQVYSDVLILLLTFYLLGGPRHSLFYSATSTYAFVAGLTFCAWVYLREKSGKKVRAGSLLAVTSLILVFGVVSVFVGGSGIKFFASSAGREATLTGRTEVWASLLPVVMGSPIVGGGFGGFWTPRTRDSFEISGAHNGYLDVLLGIGFIGLILVSMFLLSSCRKAHRELSIDLYWGLLWICYLIMSLVHNIGESSIDTFTTHLTAVLLFFTISSTRSGTFDEVVH